METCRIMITMDTYSDKNVLLMDMKTTNDTITDLWYDAICLAMNNMGPSIHNYKTLNECKICHSIEGVMYKIVLTIDDYYGSYTINTNTINDIDIARVYAGIISGDTTLIKKLRSYVDENINAA